MESKINQCKFHKTPMTMVGFERGYRIYECKLCNYEKLNKKKLTNENRK